MALEQIQHLPLELIVAQPQVRKTFDEELLEGMIASINEVGQMQPIRVRRFGKQFVIVDGERRFRSFRQLAKTTIAAIVEEDDLSEAEVLQKQLIANCQREDLIAFEKAMAISQLMSATGWNASQVAAKLGMSNATATRLLALLSLPEAIQRQVSAGEIPASAAYELSRIADPDEQAEMAHKLASGAMTRDELVGARKTANQKSAGKTATATNRAIAVLGSGHSVTVVRASLDLESFITSLEDVLNKARRARPTGVELATFLSMLKDQSRTASTH